MRRRSSTANQEARNHRDRSMLPMRLLVLSIATACILADYRSCGQERPIPPGGDAMIEKFRDSALISTIPELPGSGWLAAEPEATPQTHRLRPWGFPTVSPSHPSVFPHHGTQRITVEFSEKSRIPGRDSGVGPIARGRGRRGRAGAARRGIDGLGPQIAAQLCRAGPRAAGKDGRSGKGLGRLGRRALAG